MKIVPTPQSVWLEDSKYVGTVYVGGKCFGSTSDTIELKQSKNHVQPYIKKKYDFRWVCVYLQKK